MRDGPVTSNESLRACENSRWRSQHCPPGWGPDLTGEGAASCDSQDGREAAEQQVPGSCGVAGWGLRAAAAGRSKHSAPTVSPQRPLLKKRNIMPAGKGRLFQGSSSVSGRGQKAECGAHSREAISSPHSSPPPRSSVVGRRHLGKTCVSLFTQYLFYKSLQLTWDAARYW